MPAPVKGSEAPRVRRRRSSVSSCRSLFPDEHEGRTSHADSCHQPACPTKSSRLAHRYVRAPHAVSHWYATCSSGGSPAPTVNRSASLTNGSLLIRSTSRTGCGAAQFVVTHEPECKG